MHMTTFSYENLSFGVFFLLLSPPPPPFFFFLIVIISSQGITDPGENLCADLSQDIHAKAHRLSPHFPPRAAKRRSPPGSLGSSLTLKNNNNNNNKNHTSPYYFCHFLLNPAATVTRRLPSFPLPPTFSRASFARSLLLSCEQ